MGPQFRKFRIELLALLSLSQLLTVVGLRSAQAQTPAQPALAVQSQPATSSQSSATSDAQRPLPDINTLIRQVRAQQKASWTTFRQYTYHSSNTEIDLDSHGKAKKTTSKELETVCVDVGCFPKLLEVDGKPLSDDAMKRQNDVIDSRIAWIKERNEKKAAGQPLPPPLKIKKSDEVGDDNLIFAYSVGSFLQWGPQLGTFSNVRRVDLHGRPSIAVDYMGNPHAKANSMLDGVFRNLAGTVWVDEQDHALVRIEGKVFDDYKVGGGLLADIHKGATVQMEWTKVNDEVWLPLAFSGRGSARIMVFVSHSEQLDQHWSGYRKFRTSSTILPGVAQVPGAPQATEPTQPQP